MCGFCAFLWLFLPPWAIDSFSELVVSFLAKIFQLAGAIARNAQIVFVVSGNGVFDSLQYAIDQNLAPVISISYGSCEQNFTSNQISLLAALGQQANAQGITIVAASGDTGAADCEAPRSTIALWLLIRRRPHRCRFRISNKEPFIPVMPSSHPIQTRPRLKRR